MQFNKAGRRLYDAFMPKDMFNSMRRSKITPNHITAFSMIFAFFTLLFVLEDKLFLAGAALLIFYVVDALDGSYARYSKQTTDFGKWFDTTKDMIFYGLLIFLLGFSGYLPMSLAALMMFSVYGSTAVHDKKEELALKAPQLPYYNTVQYIVLGFFGILPIEMLAFIITVLNLIAMVVNFLLILVKAWK